MIKKHGQILYILLILFVLVDSNLAQDLLKTNKDTICFVAVSNIITDVNRLDAEAAATLAMRELTKEFSNGIRLIEPKIVSSIEEIKYSIKENKADIVGLFSLDYLKHKSQLSLEPLFILEKESHWGRKYLVLAKANSGINTLADLKSKQILTMTSVENEIVQKWLYIEMKKERIENPSNIINGFVQIEKSNKRVLPVFFGKADACIIEKSQFESMCELNPQLKTDLKILVESPEFLNAIYCKNTNSKKFGMDKALEYSKSVEHTENGNKLLKLFKSTKISGFKKHHLETIETLFNEYNFYQNN